MKSPMCLLLSRRETRHTGLSLYLGEKLIIFNCQSKHLHSLMIPKLSRYFSRFPCDLPFLDFLINIFSSHILFLIHFLALIWARQKVHRFPVWAHWADKNSGVSCPCACLRVHMHVYVYEVYARVCLYVRGASASSAVCTRWRWAATGSTSWRRAVRASSLWLRATGAFCTSSRDTARTSPASPSLPTERASLPALQTSASSYGPRSSRPSSSSRTCPQPRHPTLPSSLLPFFPSSLLTSLHTALTVTSSQPLPLGFYISVNRY